MSTPLSILIDLALILFIGLASFSFLLVLALLKARFFNSPPDNKE